MEVLAKPLAVTDPTEPAALRDALVHSGRASGSSDGLHAGTTDRDLRMLSAKYQCVHCGVGNSKGDVYINLDDPSMDEHGLNLTCLECWNDRLPERQKMHPAKDFQTLNLTEWRSICGVKWMLRGLLKDEYYERRIRWLCWDVVDKYPGECRKQRRDRLIRKSTRLAVGITNDVNRLTFDQQLEVIKLIDHWVDQWSNEE